MVEQSIGLISSWQSISESCKIQSATHQLCSLYYLSQMICLVYEYLMAIKETMIHAGPAGLTNYSWGQDFNSAINQMSEWVTVYNINPTWQRNYDYEYMMIILH